jgi:hypothetical protein
MLDMDALCRATEADQAFVRAWDQLGDAIGRTEPVDVAPLAPRGNALGCE